MRWPSWRRAGQSSPASADAGSRTPRNRRTTTRQAGFSLGEVLTVTAIVGVLSAIAVPIALQQQAKSVTASVDSELTNVSANVESALLVMNGAPQDQALWVCHNGGFPAADALPNNPCPEGTWQAFVAGSNPLQPANPPIGGTLPPGTTMQGTIDLEGEYCFEIRSTRLGVPDMFLSSADTEPHEGTCAAPSTDSKVQAYVPVGAVPLPEQDLTDVATDLPSPPTNVGTVPITEDSLKITWDGLAGQTYAVSVPGQPMKTITASDTGRLSCTFPADTCDGPVNGGIPTGSYTATVYTAYFVNGNQSQIGYGPGSNVDFGVPTAIPTPNVPTDVTAVPGNSKATVSWAVPGPDSPQVKTYTVKSDPGAVLCTTTGDADSCVVEGLSNGTAYTFTVQATNSAGSSAWSAPSPPVTPATNPDPVTGLTATPKNASVTLAWTAPTWAGGSALTDYRVEYSANNGATWVAFSHDPSTQATLTVTDLANGTAYLLRVAAVNAVGQSEWATTTGPVTPRTVPGAPTALTVAPTNLAVVLSWTAPADNGGNAIVDYKIEVRTSTGGTWIAFADGVSTATTATVTGLTNGTRYDFRVSAGNEAGYGTPVMTTAAVSPRTVPDPPRNMLGLPGDAQVQLTWDPPLWDGGSPITSYQVQVSIAPTNQGGTGALGVVTYPTDRALTGATVAGLTNGVTYQFQVKALNAAGYSTTATTTATPRSVPDPPTGLSVTVGIVSGQASLSWLAPVNDGGNAISDYAVEYRENPSGAWVLFGDGVSTTRSTTIGGLTDGVAYDFHVAAINDAGRGTFSTIETRRPFTPVRFATGYSTIQSQVGAQVMDQTPTVTGGLGTKSFTISPTLPAGMTFSTATGTIGGTPTAVQTATTHNIIATDSATGTSANTSVSITIQGTLTFTTGYTDVLATIGQPITAQTPVVSNGYGTKTWDVAPALPAGLTLSATGTLSGTPTAAQPQTPYTVTVTDGRGYLATSVVKITVQPSMTFTTPYLPIKATLGVTVPLQTPVVANGYGTKAYTISPTLPAGMTFNGTTGGIAGTPTTAQTTTTHTVTVTDGQGFTTTGSVTVTVQAAMAFTTGYTAVNQALGTAITAQTPVVAYGYGTTRQYSITPVLPAGLALNTSTGVLSGTATATQTTAVTHTVTVKDVENFTATTTVSVTIFSTPGGPTYVTPTPGNTQVGLTWTAPSASGNPITDYVVQYKRSVDSTWITFPDGTSTTAAATVTGLTNTTAYDFQVAAVNSAGTGAFSNPPVQSTPYAPITCSTTYTAVNAITGTAITAQTPTCTGGLGTRDFAVSPALPAGLSINSTSGVLSGTPTATQATAVTHNVTVTDTPTGSTTTASVAVTVKSPMAFTTGFTNINQVVNTAVTTQTPVTSNGYGTKTYSIFPALPTGMTFSTTTGAVGGTPTVIQAPAKTHTVTVTDGFGFTATTTFTAVIYTTPDPPASVNATPTGNNGEVSVTWPASNNNGNAVTDYLVQYRTAAGSTTSQSTSGRGSSFSDAGQTWASTTNAYDAGTATFATWTSSTSGAIANGNVGGYGFGGRVPAGATIDSVSATIASYVSNTSRIASVKLQPFVGDVAKSTAQTLTLSTSTTNSQTVAFSGLTAADLTDPTFTMRVTVTRAAVGQQSIMYLDYVNVTVNYTATAASAGSWQTFADGVGTTLSATVTGLVNGSSYDFQVAGVNAAGTGAYSTPVTATPSTVPDPPTSPGVTVGAAGGSASLSWVPPVSNGGNPILDYKIQYKLTAAGTWSDFNDGTSTNTTATVTGLTNASSYDFRIAAVNAAGAGLYSTAVTATPYIPLAFSPGYTAIKATQGATITTRTPTVIGGLGTKTYDIVPVLPTGLTFSTATGAISGAPTALQVATDHTVTVTDATTATSTSTLVNVTVQAPMVFTTGYTAVLAQVGTAITARTPATSNGYGTKTYTISPVLPAGLTIDAANGTISGTPTASQVATDHTVTVTDAEGFTATATINITVTSGMAFTTGFTAIKATQNIAIATQTPVVSGGYGTKTYTVTPTLPTGLSLSASTGAISGTPTATQALTTHTVRVTDGQGFFLTTPVDITVQAPMAFTTGYADINVPVNYAITARTPATSNGYGTKTYTISSGVPTGLSINSATGVISGTPTATLTAGATYTVTVTDAENFTATTSVYILVYTTPGAPTNLVATPGSTQVSLTWTAPVSNGGNAITDYQVQYRTSPAGTWTTFVDGVSTTPSATVTGLTNTTAYDFQVAAINAYPTPGPYIFPAVTSTPYAPVAFTTGYTAVQAQTGTAIASQTPAVSGGLGSKTYTVTPALPTGLSLNSATGQISGTPTATQVQTTHTVKATDSVTTTFATTDFILTVQSPIAFTVGYTDINQKISTAITTQTPTAGNGYGTKTYSVSPALPAGLALSTSTGAVSGTPTATNANTQYTVTVRDSASPTTFTATTTFYITVYTVPNAPTSVTAAGTNATGAVKVDWTAPFNNYNAVTDYVVQYKRTVDATWSTFADGTSTALTATVTGLTNGTQYDFQVAATNAAGTGAYSTPVAQATPKTQACAPTSLAAAAGTAGGRIDLTWATPSCDGGSPITDYTVQYRTSPSGTWTTYADTVSTATAATLTGLTDTVAYDFQVAAVNAIGTGGYSTAVTKTPFTPLAFSTGYTTVLATQSTAITTQTPTVTGGLGGKTYAVSPALPTGMSVNSTTGALSGTPTATQTATTHTVTVTDATSGTSLGTTVSVTVQAPMAFTTGYTAVLATQNAAYLNGSTPVVSNGYGTKTYSSTDLPAGLSVNSSTGKITGTPTATQAAANSNVRVTDAQGFFVTTAVSVTVQAPMAFTTGYDAVLATINVAYTLGNTPVVSNGYGTKTYTVSPALPTGMTISSTTGVISGTPTVTQAASSHTVTVTDGQGYTATTTVSVTVQGAMAFTTGYSPVYATQNVAYTLGNTPVVSGGFGTKTYSSTDLPAGLAINSSTGVISGTPTTVQSATNSTVRVTDAYNYSITTTVSITVLTPMAFSVGYAPLQSQTGTAIVTQTPTVTSGYGTKAYTVSPALPTGLSISSTTGAISGTPTATQTLTSHTVTVTDAYGYTKTTTISVTVQPALAFTTGYTAIKAQTGTAVTTQTPAVGNGYGTISYAIAPALPTGMSISPTTGAISGNPSATQALTVHTVTATDSSTSGPYTATTNISVTSQAPMTFTTGYTAIDAVTGTAITTQTPATANGYGTKTYTVSPALPTGMTISGTTGAISGTPSVTQNATVHTVTVRDAELYTGTTTVTVTVQSALAFTTGYTNVRAVRTIAIATQTPATASGYGTVTYSISPSLTTNTGLTFSTATGAISGTPTTVSASTTYTVTATDTRNYTATTTFTLQVAASLSLAGYTTVNQAVSTAVTSQTPTTSGGYTPYTFTVAPTLPAGMSVAGSTGVLSGTPTATQTTAVIHTVTMTDNAGFTTTATVSVLIYTVPGAPTGLTATATGATGTVTLNWTAPTSDGGNAINDYVVQYRTPSGTGTWATYADGVSTTQSATVSGLSDTATYDFQVAAKNTAGTGAYSTAATTTPYAPLTISGYTDVFAVTGTAITAQSPTVAGGYGTRSFSISPALSAGLALNTATGQISGTPTATQTVRTHTVTVSDATTLQSAQTSLNVTVQAPLALSGLTEIQAQTGTAITTQTPTITNGYGTSTAWTWSISPALPTGLALSSTTGAISGTPTATVARTQYTVSTTDSRGYTASTTVWLTVQAPIAFTTGYTAIQATRDIAITTQTPVVANGYGTKTYTVAPALPTGLALDAGTGAISGTPTLTQVATNYTITVTDTAGFSDKVGSGGRTFTSPLAITVQAPMAFTTNYTNIVAPISVAYTGITPAVSNGYGTKTYAIDTTPGYSPLPTGLSINTTTGVISGTPTAAQTTPLSTRVRVTDANGFTVFSAAFTVQVTTVASAPTNLSAAPVVATASRVDLTWTKPTSNGGTPITDYTIEYKKSTDPDTSYAAFAHTPIANADTAATFTFPVTGLTGRGSYTFRVSAVNAVGTSTASGTASTTPYNVPDVTVITSATSTPPLGSAALAWNAPSDTGQSAITSYDVQYRTSPSGTWSPATPLSVTSGTSTTVSGLTAGTAYDFQVRAVNTYGAGAWSTASTATMATVASAPTAVSAAATGASGAITVTWSAPTTNGGSAITNFQVEYKRSVDGTYTVLSPLTVANPTGAGPFTATISNLTNNTVYDFRVTAITAYGLGTYSTAVQATPVTVPTEPQTLSATPGYKSLTVNWAAPASDGGATITGYLVQYAQVVSGVQGAWAPATPTSVNGTTFTTTFSNLAAGGTYVFRVAASNANTNGSNNVWATSGQYVVRGQSATTGVTVLSVTANTVATAPTGTTTAAIPAGATIIVHVVSDSATATTPTFTLSAPAAGSGLTWAATTANSSSTLAGFASAGTATSGTGITQGLFYGYTSAQIPAGTRFTVTPSTLTGLYSSMIVEYVTGVAIDASNVPVVRSISTNKSTTAATAVTIPSAGTITAQTGDILIAGVGQEFKTITGSATSWSTATSVVSGSGANASWAGMLAQDRAIASGGTFNYSMTMTNAALWTGILVDFGSDYVAAAVPSAPTGLTGTVGTSQTVALSWNAPTNDGGAAITGYSIQYSLAGANSWTTVTSTNPTYTLSTLTNKTAYDFRVAATNSAGTGAYSSILTRTPYAPLAISTSITAIQATTGIAYTSNQPATSGGVGTPTWSIAPATPLPAGMSINTTTGVVSGTPTATQVATSTTLIANDATSGTSATAAFNITVQAPMAISGYNSLFATQNVAYTLGATPAASNGYGTKTWSAPGLPTGMTINSSTGVISGTPTTVQAATNSTVTVTDGQGFTATATVSITVQAPMVITGYNSAFATQNAAYTLGATPAASNGYGTKTWSATGLPTGMTINSSTGVISGTPTVTQASTNATVTVTDVYGYTATAAVPVTVQAPMVISGYNSVFATQNVAYTLGATPAASNGYGASKTWTATGLPAGMTINSSTGVISGTPTAVQAATNATVTVTDIYSYTATATVSITVQAPMAISGYNSVFATQNVAYTLGATPAASNGYGTKTWSATGLPAGMAISSTTGVVSGTPTATQAATNATVTVTDIYSYTATATVSVTVQAPMAFTTGYTAVSAQQSTAYTAGSTPVVSNGYGTKTYSIDTTAAKPALPTGLSISPTTGAISGTPTVTQPLTTTTVLVTDTYGYTASTTVDVTVKGALAFTSTYPALQLQTGTAYTGSAAAVTNNYGTVTYAITPAADATTFTGTGLTLSATTGAVSGTPSSTLAAKTFTVTATDAATGYTATRTFNLTIQPALAFTTGYTSIQAQTGTAIATQTPVITTGTGYGTKTFTISPALPTGLTLDSATGALSGSPSATQAVTTHTVTVTDSASPTAFTRTTTFSLTVQAPLTFATAYATIQAQTGTAIATQTPTVTASTGYGTLSYSISPALPTGMAFSTSTGAISGTPTATQAATTHSVTVTDSATPTAFSKTTTVSVTVQAPLTFATGYTTVQAQTGTAIATQTPAVTASTGYGTLTYTISPALPTGMAIDGATGAISGTPSTTQATTSHTITVRDSATPTTFTATASFSLTVQAAIAFTSTYTNIYSGTGTAIATQTPTVTGGYTSKTYAFDSTGGRATTLPTGLSLSTTTGAISGTPTATQATALTFRVKVTDGATPTAFVAFSNDFTVQIYTIPSAPQNLRGNTGGATGEVDLAWDQAVGTDGGNTITDYTIQWRGVGSGTGKTYTPRGAGFDVGTGGAWTNTANAYDAGTGTAATYTVSTVTTNNAYITGYNFADRIPTNATLVSAVVTTRHLVSNTNRLPAPKIQAYNGATALGTLTTLTSNATTYSTNTVTLTGITMADLRNPAFKMLWQTSAVTASGQTGGTLSLDYVEVKVTYDTFTGTYATFADGTSTNKFATVTGLTVGNPYEFQVAAVNGAGTSAWSTSATVTVTAPLVFATGYTAIQGTVGVPFTGNAPTVTGGIGTLAYTVTPALPAGLTLSGTTGQITGTPTATQATTTHTVTVSDTQTLAAQDTTVSVTVQPAMTFSTAYLPLNITQNRAYTSNTPQVADGYGTKTYSAASLPTGLSINATTGVISGTVTTTLATTNYSITVTDATSASISVNVPITVQAPMVLTYAPVYATQNAPYTLGTAPTLTNGYGSARTYSGTVPAGLSLSASTGVISGTPTTVQAATNATITVADESGATVTGTVSITVVTPMAWTTNFTALQAQVGTAITNQQGAVSGGYGASKTYTVSPALPAGLTLSSAGVLSGTPSAVTAAANYTITATDTYGYTLTSVINIQVKAALALTYPATGVRAQINTAITAVSATTSNGYGTLTYSISPALPAGLTLDTATGQISGTPTATQAQTTHTVTLRDSASPTLATATATLPVTVKDPLALSGYTDIYAPVGVAITTQTPTVSNGYAPYTFAVSPALPAGLALDTSTGAISGTPTATVMPAGSYTVSVTGTLGYTASAAPLSIYVFTVPGAPTLSIAATDVQEVDLTWAVPASDGGDPIVDYIVQYKKTADSTWTTYADGYDTDTSENVLDLVGADGTSFDLRVAAVNGAGTGPWSNTVSATPIQVPIRPTGLNAAANTTSGQAALSWTAPVGQAGITDYTVQYRVTGTTTGTGNVTKRGSAASTAGTTWTTVTNAYDAGSATYAAYNWASTADDTTAAKTIYVSGYNFGAVVQSDAVLNSVTLQVRSYVSQVARFNAPQVQTYLGSTAKGTVTGSLTQTNTAATYTLTVTGLTLADLRDPSFRIGFVANHTGTQTGTQYLDYIDAVANITHPDLSWTTFADGVSTGTTATVTGLTDGTSYEFQVKTVAGTASSLGSTAAVLLIPAAPSTPTGLTATVTAVSGQVKLDWVVSSSNGGYPFTDYSVQYRTNNPQGAWTEWTHTANATLATATITGLTDLTAYDFQVAAKNAYRTSVYTAAVTATPQGYPGAPASITATATNTYVAAGQSSVKVDWTAPTIGASTVTGYRVGWRTTSPQGAWTYSTTQSASTFTFTTGGLAAGTSYDFQVQATNASAVWGTGSTILARTPVTVPDPVNLVTGFLATTGTSKTINLSWNAPAANGSAITDYVIQYSTTATAPPTGYTTIADGTSATPSASVTVPSNGVAYYFTITAVNNVGTSNYPASPDYVSATAYSAPSAPAAPTVAVPAATSSMNSVAVTFTAPSDNGGLAVNAYEVSWSTDSGATWTVAGTYAAAGTQTITGLYKGTYIWRVRASNATYGYSAYSASSSTVTPTSAVMARGTIVTAGNTTANTAGVTSAVTATVPSPGIPAGAVVAVHVIADATAASVTTPSTNPTIDANALTVNGAAVTGVVVLSQGASTAAGSGFSAGTLLFHTAAGLPAGATITISLGTAVITSKAIVVEYYENALITSGAPTVRSSTPAYSTATNNKAPTVTTSTAPQIGDAVIGVSGVESNAAHTTDVDTLNGSWSTLSGLAANTGTVGTSVWVGTQSKIVNAAGNQTFNPVQGVNARWYAGVLTLQPA